MVKDKIVLMLGPDASSKGGIASVVSVYLQSSLPSAFNVEYIATTQDGSRLKKLVRGFLTFARVGRLVFSGRVALVHVHSASYVSFFRKSLFMNLARMARVPTILHIHGAEFEKFVDHTASTLMRALTLYTMRRVDCIVALSDRWKEYFLRLAPSAFVEVIANPVKVPPEQSSGAETFGRILFLGRAEQRKGIFDLIQAMRLVSARIPEAKLVICGDGDLNAVKQAAQQAGVQAGIEILGWIRGDDKEVQIQRAQVFVLPSYDEGLPVSMLEAMAYGKAVLVSGVGGIPEAVGHLEQGVLIKPGDPNQLAEQLIALLESPDLRKRLGAAARMRVQERFSQESVIEQLTRLYTRLGVSKRT